MKPSEILREAARRVESETECYACCALMTVQGIKDASDHKTMETLCATQAFSYFALFRPDHIRESHYCETWFRSDIFVSASDQRVVALTLAAAIAESEGQ